MYIVLTEVFLYKILNPLSRVTYGTDHVGLFSPITLVEPGLNTTENGKTMRYIYIKCNEESFDYISFYFD